MRLGRILPGQYIDDILIDLGFLFLPQVVQKVQVYFLFYLALIR